MGIAGQILERIAMMATMTKLMLVSNAKMPLVEMDLPGMGKKTATMVIMTTLMNVLNVFQQLVEMSMSG